MNKINLEQYNWIQIQEYYNQCNNKNLVMQKFNLSRYILNLARQHGLFKCLVIKHSWQRQNKKYSPPCEIFKNFLTSNGIKFCQQYKDRDVWKHNYSIDIAFPKQKIGIQINGNMHYDKNGNLSKYYQVRHDLIQSFGWKIYQIPYLLVYNQQMKKQILQMLKQNIDISFDYKQFIKMKQQEKQKKHICPICGGYKKQKYSKCCAYCNLHRKKKLKMLKLNKFQNLKQQLEQLVKQHSLQQIGRMLGVTGNAIKKHCVRYNINYKQYRHYIATKNYKKKKILT